MQATSASELFKKCKYGAKDRCNSIVFISKPEIPIPSIIQHPS